MISTLLPKLALKFFFRDGVTSALFRWLNFRLFTAQKKLKLDAAELPSSEPASATHYLTLWEQKAAISSTAVKPAHWVVPLISLIVVAVGFGAMAGVLNFSDGQPINIWVPLALFAFIPFLLTLCSLYFSIFSSGRQSVTGHPLLIFLVNKLNVRQFVPYKNLLMPWLFWQSQKLALLFSVSALVSFFVLATFQNYQFGWSSTLITDNATMTHIMRIITWPWHWFIASPTEVFVSQSRFSASESSLAIENGNWWLIMVMAIVVYGILPRLLLALYLRFQLVRKLKSSIVNSGEVEKFIVAQKHQSSLNPIQFDSELEDLEWVNIRQGDVITWQQPHSDLKPVKNLGSSDWLEDEKWLSSQDSARINPIFIVVDPEQTPTGELADCIDLLKNKNSAVTLVLVTTLIESDRHINQIKSWQFFAKHHSIELKKGS